MFFSYWDYYNFLNSVIWNLLSYSSLWESKRVRERTRTDDVTQQPPQTYLHALLVFLAPTLPHPLYNRPICQAETVVEENYCCAEHLRREGHVTILFKQ